MRRMAVVVLLWLLISVATAVAWTHGAPPTADPLASAQTINTLVYLRTVTQRSTHRIVTGQQVGAVDCCFQHIWTIQYPVVITDLFNATGKYPGIEGWSYIDYNGFSPGTPVDYTAMNNQMIIDAHAGSIMHIYYAPMNPWTGGNATDTSCGGGTIADLVNPAMPVYTTWHNQLAHVAAALQQLQAAGVTVMWRPLPEGNSQGFWYGNCLPLPITANAGNYTAVWKDMFQQFTQTYGLHNLLWVWSVVTQVNATWQNLEPTGYFDICGWDWYTDTTSPVQSVYYYWTWFYKTNKLFGYTERGPAEIDGTSQMYTTLLDGIVNNFWSSVYPIVPFFMAFDNGWALQNNPGGQAIMTDTRAATRTNVQAALSCMATAATYTAKRSCVLN